MSEKDWWNRNVFSCRRKEERDGADWMSLGRCGEKVRSFVRPSPFFSSSVRHACLRSITVMLETSFTVVFIVSPSVQSIPNAVRAQGQTRPLIVPIAVLWRPVRAPGHNAPLIRFLISCIFISPSYTVAWNKWINTANRNKTNAIKNIHPNNETDQRNIWHK